MGRMEWKKRPEAALLNFYIREERAYYKDRK